MRVKLFTGNNKAQTKPWQLQLFAQKPFSKNTRIHFIFMSQCEGASLFRVYNTFSQKWHLHGQDNSTYLSEIIKNSTYHGSTLKCHQITQLIKHWMYPYTMHFSYLSSKNVNFWFLNKGPWYLPFSSMCSLSS